MEAETRPTPGAREAIVAAATELIRTHGVAGTSISEIVARSGTSAGAIYHHFGNKEHLVLEVAQEAIARPMSLVLNTAAGSSPAELLDAAIVQVTLDERTPELVLQIWAGAQANEELSRLLKSEVGSLRVTLLGLVNQWCAAHAPASDPDCLVDVMVSLVAGFAVQQALGLTARVEGYRGLGARLVTATTHDPLPVERGAGIGVRG